MSQYFLEIAIVLSFIGVYIYLARYLSVEQSKRIIEKHGLIAIDAGEVQSNCKSYFFSSGKFFWERLRIQITVTKSGAPQFSRIMDVVISGTFRPNYIHIHRIGPRTESEYVSHLTARGSLFPPDREKIKRIVQTLEQIFSV